MKKYFYYKKKDGHLSMITDSPVEVDKTIFDVISKNVSDKQITDIEDGKKTFIEKGKFRTVKYTKKELNLLQERTKNIEILKAKINKAKDIGELKQYMNELIDNLD